MLPRGLVDREELVRPEKNGAEKNNGAQRTKATTEEWCRLQRKTPERARAPRRRWASPTRRGAKTNRSIAT